MNVNVKNKNKPLFCGILILLLLTVASQITSIFNMILSHSPEYYDSVFTGILYTVRTLFDSFIFALGAAFIIHFTRTGNKHSRTVSLILTIVILTCDYTTSFLIDLFSGNIPGYEVLTLIYLAFNILIRAAMYGLVIIFSNTVLNNRGAGADPVPFLCVSHPANLMIGSAFIVRIVPYILFEIYSNITGIIEYGFDMTASDVISIISAYVEILIDGIIVYIAIYLFLNLFVSKDKK